MKECENCGDSHDGKYGSGRFCSTKCSRGFSTKAKRTEINAMVSKTLTGSGNENVTIICKYDKCKKSITVDWRNRNQKYCSKSCSHNDIVVKECKICNEQKKIKRASKICIDCKEPYRLYKEQCVFKFNVNDHPDLFDLSLIKKHGWYSPSNSKHPNLNGISRDHMFSIAEGFKQNVPPELIASIYNCKLMQHNENTSKNTECSISLQELKNIAL